MSSFEQSWSLMKNFYIDPNDSNTARVDRWRFGIPSASLGGPPRPEIVRHGKKGSDGEKYYTSYNLASPYFRNKDWGHNSKTDKFGITEFDEGSQEMTEDERIRRIIDTIVHEEGHAAIDPPLRAEAHEDWMNDSYEQAKLSDFQPSTNTHEAGAMLVEGIPFDQQADVLRRRGYL